MTILRRWWTKKYQLPWTHELAQNSTEFELAVEFFEDLFEKDPKAMLEAARGADGEIHFEETDDELIDKWERELAQGITPDLTEGLPESVKAQLAKERAHAEHAKSMRDKLLGVSDSFSDPMYESKFVAPGSEEERRLRARALMAGKGFSNSETLGHEG